MATTTREITFVARMRDDARRTMEALGTTLQRVASQTKQWAQAAQTAAKAQNTQTVATNTSTNALIKQQTAITGLGRQMTSLRGIINTLRNATLALGLSFGSFFILQASDDWATYGNRIRQVTASEGEMIETRERLFEASQRSFAPMEGLVGLYSRAAVTLRDLGRSTEESLHFVETFSKALTIGGASGAEAASATLQFAQALGAGALRSEEFNAVNEASQRVMRLLAQEMGVNVGQLKSLAAQGKITSQVLADAMLHSRDQIDAEFARMVPTWTNAGTVLRNALVRSVGRLDADLNIQSTIAPMLIDFADNQLPKIEERLVHIAHVVGPVAIAFFGGMGDALKFIEDRFVPLVKGLVSIGENLNLLSHDAATAQTRLNNMGQAVGMATASMFAFTAIAGTVVSIVRLFSTLGAAMVTWGAFGAVLLGLVIAIVTLRNTALNPLQTTLVNLVAVVAGVVAAFGTFRISTIVVGAAINAFRAILAALAGGAVGATGTLSALWAVLVANPVSAVIAIVAGLITTFMLLRTSVQDVHQAYSSLEGALSMLADQTIVVNEKQQQHHTTTGQLKDVTTQLAVAERDLSKAQDDATGSTKDLTAEQKALLAVRRENLLTTLRQASADAQAAIDRLHSDISSRNTGESVLDLMFMRPNANVHRRNQAANDAAQAEVDRLRSYQATVDQGVRDIMSGRREIPVTSVVQQQIHTETTTTNTTNNAGRYRPDPRMRQAQLFSEMSDYIREWDERVSTAKSSLDGLANTYLTFTERQRQSRAEQQEVANLLWLQEHNAMQFQEALTKAGMSEDDFRYAVERSRLEAARSLPVMDQLRLAAMRYVENASKGFDAVREMGQRVFQGLEDAVTEFVTTGKLNFGEFVRSVLLDLAKIAAKKAIISFISSVIGIKFPVGHTGGLAGSNITGSRTISPFAFAGAQRYHSGGLAGLKDGEVPIIAKKGEALMPTVRLPDGTFGVRAELPAFAGGGASINNQYSIAITVNPTGDNLADQRAAEKTAAELKKIMEAISREQVAKADRPGGAYRMRP